MSICNLGGEDISRKCALQVIPDDCRLLIITIIRVTIILFSFIKKTYRSNFEIEIASYRSHPLMETYDARHLLEAAVWNAVVFKSGISGKALI